MQSNESEFERGGRVALVSGCSSGIGRVIAAHLARAGWVVFAGLRRGHDAGAGDGLRALGLHPLELDVTDSAQCAAAIERIGAERGRLDALVNNAGVDALGAVEDQPEATLRSVMEVNFFGAMTLTQRALPLMRRGRGTTIVMVSSLSGLLGLPGSSAYCASKFALEGAAEALRNEVGRFGVRVSLIEPGGFASAMSSKRVLTADYPPDSLYLPMLEHLAQGRPAIADPTPVAELVLEIIDSPAPRLRYAAGKQAVEVVERLGALDDESRQRYARAVMDLDWWHEGGTPGSEKS
jgi:NAD(P)-dependent dehydrogenase (short-subunit alcohol dehydrogenase family)